MRTLEVEANLLAICESTTVGFSASGKNGVLSFSSSQHSVSNALRILPLSAGSRENLRRLHRGCSAQEMSLTLEVAGRAVAQLGRQCEPGLFSRLLGVYPVEVRLLPLLSVIFEAAMAGKGSSHIK